MAKKSAFFRLVRLVKWCVILAAFGIFAAVASLYILVSPERVAEELSAFSESRMGLQLKLSGPVEIRHLPKIEISVPSGAFFDPADGAQVATFESGRLRIAPWGLPIGQAHVSRIEMTGLKAGILFPDAEALRAWAASPLFAPSGKWIEPVVIRRFILENSDISIDGIQGAPAMLHVKHLETTELAARMSPKVSVSASLSAPARELEADFETAGSVDFDIASQIIGLQKFSFSSSGKYRGAPFTATAGTESFQYTQGVTTADAVDAEAVWNGEIPAKAAVRVTGLSTKGGLTSGRVEQLEVIRRLPGGTESLKAAADFAFAAETKALDLPALTLEATVAADNLPALDASLSGKARAAFDEPSASLDAEGTLNSAPVKLSGSWKSAPEPLVSVSLSADSLDLSAKADAPDAYSLRELATGAVTPLSDALGGTKLEASFAVKQLKKDLLEASGLAASLTLEKGALAVRGFEAQLAGGRVGGTLDAAPDGTWAADIEASGIRYEELARAFGAESLVTGTLGARFAVKGTDLEAVDPAKTLSGTVEFALEDGTAAGLSKEPLAFSSIKGSAALLNGIATCENLALSSKSASLSGTAEADLRTMEIAGDATVETHEGKRAAASIDGTVFRPEWSLSEPIEPAPEEPAAPAEKAPEAASSAAAAEAQSPAAAAEPLKGSSGGSAPAWFDRIKGWAAEKIPAFKSPF